MSVGNEGLFGGRESELVLDQPTDPDIHRSVFDSLTAQWLLRSLGERNLCRRVRPWPTLAFLPTDFERDHGGGLVLALLVRASMAVA